MIDVHPNDRIAPHAEAFALTARACAGRSLLMSTRSGAMPAWRSNDAATAHREAELLTSELARARSNIELVHDRRVYRCSPTRTYAQRR